MAASYNDLKQWFNEGEKLNATHMIIVCDEFDHEDYPVYVYDNEDAKTIADSYDNKNMSRIMEVYKISLGWISQSKKEKVVNY